MRGPKEGLSERNLRQIRGFHDGLEGRGPERIMEKDYDLRGLEAWVRLSRV